MPGDSMHLHSPEFLALEQHGFQLIERVFDASEIETLRAALDRVADDPGIRRRNGDTFAVRNLLMVAPSLASLIKGAKVRSVVEKALSPCAFLVRSILFDKVPAANWTVPWHQDTAIPVRERRDTAGFGPWSNKAGVTHVRPPAEVLEGMITLRIHLDTCDSDSGALLVIPGSHKNGFIDETEIGRLVTSQVPHACEADCGSVLLMKPLLLHASRPAREPSRRRVVHLEYACEALPDGLVWHAAESVITASTNG